MNPLLLLPTPVRVRTGDALRVCTCAAAESTRPSYTFTLERLATRPGVAAEPLGSVSVGLDELYPDYGV